MGLKRLKTGGRLAVVAFSLYGVSAKGITLGVGNSSITVNPTSGASFTPYISSWVVDGVDQYGGSPAGSEDLIVGFGMGTAAGLNEYPLTSSTSTATTFSGTYAENGVTMKIVDVLAGGAGGSGQSSFNETFSITNASSDSILFHLSDAVQLNVGGSDLNNVLNLAPSGAPNTATQTNGAGTTVRFSYSPTPDNFYTSPDGGNTETANTGPVTGEPAFDFSWSPEVNAGQTLTFGISETVNGGVSSGGGTSSVPLPTSAGMVVGMLTAMGVVSIARRQQRWSCH